MTTAPEVVLNDQTITDWRIGGAGRPPVLVGFIDGKPMTTPPVVQVHLGYGLAVLASGIVLRLGPSAEAEPDDLLAFGCGPAPHTRGRIVDALAPLRAGTPPTAVDLVGAPVIHGWCVGRIHGWLVVTGRIQHDPTIWPRELGYTAPLTYLAPDQTTARVADGWVRLGRHLNDVPHR